MTNLVVSIKFKLYNIVLFSNIKSLWVTFEISKRTKSSEAFLMATYELRSRGGDTNYNIDGGSLRCEFYYDFFFWNKCLKSTLIISFCYALANILIKYNY